MFIKKSPVSSILNILLCFFNQLTSHFFLLIVSIITLSMIHSCTGKPISEAESQSQLLKMELGTLKPEDGIWGVLIVDLSTNDTIVDINSQTAFRPASLTKLFTTAAAIDLLPTIDFASMEVSELLQADSTVD